MKTKSKNLQNRPELADQENWSKLAREAQWSVSGLAKILGVSTSTLQRYFLKMMGKTPKDWLADHRQHQATVLLRDGFSVKETAANLGYNQPTNFTRKFKAFWGVSPSLHASANTNSTHKIRRND